MKPIEYKHSWRADTSQYQEMEERFGTLLHEENTADSYEVAESHLYKKGDKFYWLQANGCSCWDGDFQGWEMDAAQLFTLALARSGDEDRYGGPDHEKLMGLWILGNLKEKNETK